VYQSPGILKKGGDFGGKNAICTQEQERNRNVEVRKTAAWVRE
jgi:hypothetical protein